MSEIRLFSPARLNADCELTLSRDQSRYVRNVLRKTVSDKLILFDGSGDEFPATISAMNRQEVTIETGSPRRRDRESKLAIHLVQGVSRGERMDFVVQKATELGVTRITPVLTRYSVVKLEAGRSAKRAIHWQRIARSACEQCGRNIVPQIDAPIALDDYLQSKATTDLLRIYLRPGAASEFDSLPDDIQELEIAIGPEGGLHENEIERLRTLGFVAASLGPRILRTETAAIAAISVAQSRWGDM